jgi:anti-anti-sigma factor
MKNPNEANLTTKILEQTSGDYIAISFDGDLDKLGLDAAKPKIDEVVEKLEKKFLVFDFTGLNFINSESIGYLITVYYRLVKQQKNLAVVGASDHVKDVLQVIGINEIIKSYENMDGFEKSLNGNA